MTSVLLPAKPVLSKAKVRLLDWNGRLVPQIGGVVQVLQRLGTRSSVEYVIPPMRSEPLGRIWAMKLREAKLAGAMIPFLQDGLAIGAPGAIVVDGAGQTGSFLAVRGGTPGYCIRYGQAFSLIHGGRRYLHFAAAETILGGLGTTDAGKATVPIAPMLRVIPGDGAVCEFGVPMIEGSLSGNEVAWDVDTAPWTNVGTIRIDEDA